MGLYRKLHLFPKESSVSIGILEDCHGNGEGMVVLRCNGLESIQSHGCQICALRESWEAAKIDGKITARKKHGEKNPGGFVVLFGIYIYMCLLGMKYGMNKLTVTCLLVCFFINFKR